MSNLRHLTVGEYAHLVLLPDVHQLLRLRCLHHLWLIASHWTQILCDAASLLVDGQLRLLQRFQLLFYVIWLSNIESTFVIYLAHGRHVCRTYRHLFHSLNSFMLFHSLLRRTAKPIDCVHGVF